MGDYGAYLRSPHWRSIRAWALARANYCCESCRWPDLPHARRDNGWERHLHAHHLTYERVGAERPGDIKVLCAICHADEHDRNSKDLWDYLYISTAPWLRAIAAATRRLLEANARFFDDEVLKYQIALESADWDGAVSAGWTESDIVEIVEGSASAASDAWGAHVALRESTENLEHQADREDALYAVFGYAPTDAFRAREFGREDVDTAVTP